MDKKRYPVITLDGPAGAGKTTMARYLAQVLDGFAYLDTGAVYRAIAYADGTGTTIPLEHVDIGIRFTRGGSGHLLQAMLLDGAEIQDSLLRTQRISERASEISTHPAIRAKVNEICRAAASSQPLIAEGRDTGTVMFPDADMKFYLYASLEERAQRRKQQAYLNGDVLELDEVMRSIAARDKRDSTRGTDPLRFPPDAIWIDTGAFLEEGVKRILRDAVRARLHPDAAPVI